MIVSKIFRQCSCFDFILFHLADQTPTPTRLIRNCGEVGFDLIEDFNVFEETFRREVSSKKNSNENSSLDTPDIHNEDTLHTPNVLGYFRLSSNEKHSENVKKDEKEKKQSQSIERQKSENETKKLLVKELETTKEIDSTIAQCNNTIANTTTGTIVPAIILPAYVVPLTKFESNSVNLNLTSTNTNVKLLKRLRPKVIPKPNPNVKNPVKEKLKAILLRTKNNTVQMPPAENHSVIQEQPLAIPERTPTIERRILKSSVKIKTSDGNRAAAKRYRMKMKDQHDLIIKDNARLAAENQTLRTEIEALRKILQSHQNCSETKKIFVVNGMTPQNANVPAIYVIQENKDNINKDINKNQPS